MVSRFPSGSVRDHVKRTEPGGGRSAYNTRLLHLEEISLGRGEFVWVQIAGFGKECRTRDRREVMENAMLLSGG